ncbi:histone H3 domain-containing protein, partial [Reticulomyxa filosa]
MNVVLRLLEEDPSLEKEPSYVNSQSYPRLSKVRSIVSGMQTDEEGGNRSHGKDKRNNEEDENEHQQEEVEEEEEEEEDRQDRYLVKQVSFDNEEISLTRYPSLQSPEYDGGDQLLPKNPTVPLIHHSSSGLPPAHPALSKKPFSDTSSSSSAYSTGSDALSKVPSPLVSTVSSPPSLSNARTTEDSEIDEKSYYCLSPHNNVVVAVDTNAKSK